MMKNHIKSSILSVILIDVIFGLIAVLNTSVFGHWIGAVTVIASQMFLTVMAAFFMIKGIVDKKPQTLIAGTLIGVTTLFIYFIAYQLAYRYGNDLIFGIVAALYMLKKWAIGFTLLIGSLILFDAVKSRGA